MALDAEHPVVHAQAIELRHALKPVLDTMPPKVQEVLKADFTVIPPTADLKKLNSEFSAKHKDSIQHKISATRVAILLGDDRGKAEKDLASIISSKTVTFDDAVIVLEQLRSWRSGETAAFKKAAHERWPDVTFFA